jgi:mannose-1-phosphate guanylyltransferase
MVRLRDACVVEGRFDWEDLGSWDSWVRIARSAGHPSTRSPVLWIHGEPGQGPNGAAGVRCLVGPDGRLVATVGLKDAVVVQSADATLVCRTSDAQHVRAVVKRLMRDARLRRYL